MGKITNILHFLFHGGDKKKEINNTVNGLNGNNNTIAQGKKVTIEKNVYTSSCIIPMNDFLSTWKTRTDYISFPNFAQLKNDLLSQDGITIRFLGLSGLGKSRLIYEVFSTIDNEHNYYCAYASDSRVLNDVMTLLSKNEETSGFIILDNCNTQSFMSLLSTVQNLNSKFKIIAIHNDPMEQASSPGVNVIKLRRADLKNSVDDFIDSRLKQISCDDSSVHEQIRNMSDGFPQIAIRAVEAYEAMGRTQLINDEIL